jgi:hypothetical protein
LGDWHPYRNPERRFRAETGRRTADRPFRLKSSTGIGRLR